MFADGKLMKLLLMDCSDKAGKTTPSWNEAESLEKQELRKIWKKVK
jgi:hypothetical protein